MNVIFHIDEPAKWPVLLSNVHHYCDWLQAQSDNSTLEVLINGAAVTGATMGSEVDLSLLARTVNVVVCANSMHQRDLTQAQLQAGITIVPSGVVELAQRQHHGFAYIKP